MLTMLLLLSSMIGQTHHDNAAGTSPVPGGCAEPAAANVGKSGCYASGELRIERSPQTIYWHIYRFSNRHSAKAEAARHPWSSVAASHGRTWLFVLGPRRLNVGIGERVAAIGPMPLPRGKPMMARFLESDFPAGMRTRVHSHPGPEGFYVVQGEQCMDTPTGRTKIAAGGTHVVRGGPHMQAATMGVRISPSSSIRQEHLGCAWRLGSHPIFAFGDRLEGLVSTISHNGQSPQLGMRGASA